MASFCRHADGSFSSNNDAGAFGAVCVACGRTINLPEQSSTDDNYCAACLLRRKESAHNRRESIDFDVSQIENPDGDVHAAGLQ